MASSSTSSPKPDVEDKDGGFDVAWPEFDAGTSFSKEVVEALARKGWCIVQTTSSAEMSEEAYKQATSSLRGFDSQKEEFLSDYQGKKPHGKIAFMETDYAGVKDDALSMFDRDLTSLTASLVSVCSGIGLNIVDRHPAMVWCPFGSKKEERMFQAEPLTEDDVDDGTIEKHILFLKRRGLCLFNMVENDGGEFSLTARENSHLTSLRLTMTRNRLVIFKSDEFSFGYEPTNTSDRHLAMVSWTLAPDPRSQIDLAKQVPFNDSKAASLVLGIKGESIPLPTGDRVHILNMMCRYPGGSFGPSSYWNALLAGIDGYLPIPESRWDTRVFCTESINDRIPGKCYARHGGFCKDDEIYEFDREFFGIDEDEAAHMCPGQKILLEDGYTTLQGVGYTKETAHGKPIGVFVGDTGSDWTPMKPAYYYKAPQGTFGFSGIPAGPGQPDHGLGGASAMALGGVSNAVTCARLSNIMGLNGPVGTADTACSSSLVASGVAMSFVRPRKGQEQGESVNRFKEAIVNGTCTQIGPFSYIGMCALSMISPMGRCFTFDQSGDGYARGEGIGTIFLRASDDGSDTLQQLACLLGNAINQDGRSASMTAPNGPSQTAVIQASMRESMVKASDIDIAECHGTGTALGDPIEVGALRNAMEPRDTVLATASAKCHIGHLEGGAGMAGICKCIAMIRADCASPNQHLKELNPNLTIAGFPILFQTEAASTCRNSSLAGVSSFGFGGTNGRSDLWGVTRTGLFKAGEVDISKIGQIVVKCPITAGPIDYLTGEPVIEGEKKTGLQLANVLRDESADYHVSRFVYKGGYRYRADEVDDDEEDELKEGSLPYVSGSWNGFSEMQAMEQVPGSKGAYVVSFRMGECRCELFNICINKQRSATISPVLDNAHSLIHVQGPGRTTGNHWLVDGRDKMQAGDIVQITLRLFTDRKEVSWAKAEAAISAREGTIAMTSDVVAVPEFTHVYSAMGSLNGGRQLAMMPTEPGTWTCSFKIGEQGKDDFYFVRDGDTKQAIYPASSTNQLGEAACGPDSLGHGKFWFVRGRKGEEVTLALMVVNAEVTVTVSGSGRPVKVWKSKAGYERHSYAVTGSLTNLRPVDMEPDPSTPGIFKARIVRGLGDASIVESFKILVDGDPNQAFAPERDADTPGAHATIVPGSGVTAQGKFVVQVPAGGEMHITLDLRTLDRRQTVKWRVLQSSVNMA